MLGTSWKTSLIGWLLIGGDVMAFISKTLEAQALPNTLFEWVAFGMAMIAGIGMILAKDRDVTGLPKVVPALLLAIMVMGLASCTHDLDIGKGRVSHLFQVSQGSIDAVSDSRSRLYNCPTPTIDKNNYAATVYDFQACTPMESEWRQSAAQPITGQVVGGALIGVGAGVGGALSEAGGAASNAVSNAVSSSSAAGGGRR